MPTKFQDDAARHEHDFLNEPRDPASHDYMSYSQVYQRLHNGVEKLYDRNKNLWNEVSAHLDDARGNANDTVDEYKKDRPSQKFWDDMLTGTLGSILSSSDPSEKAKAHWKSHGIKW
jgi:hypothetical protein